MAITVKHSKVSTIPDDADTSLVRPSDWNADHTLSGTVPVANGGTGASTLTGYVKGNGTSAMTASATVPSTDVTGLGTMSTQNANSVAITGGSITGTTVAGYIPTTEKAAALGVATLDAGGTIPLSQIPASIQGGVSYQGTWNASTNTPTLTNGVGTKGYYYVVSVAGSTNLDGITSWNVGDWAIFNGTVWQKVDNTDAVTSVNGFTGTVVLTTTDVAEGTNQYFTTARARTSVSAGTGISYDNATGVITNASPSLGGDVVGPASATDNAIARFDSTTGKLIQNSVVTVGDTGAATGFTTLSASTSVTTPIVQASNSGGLALKNSGGTTQMSVGAGGGDNMSINVSTNLNGTNAQIDISPTGTGHVHMNPSGTGSVQINPTSVGTMDNMTIGATTAKNASFVDLSVTGTTSFDGSQGTAGQVLTSAGTGATPTWTTPTTGTVTSVTGTAPVVSSGGTTPAISMPAATTSVSGYLTSTDWTTFNNKGSGSVTSVAATVPSFLSVSGSPITTSGTLAFTYSGTALPILNGGTGQTTASAAFNALSPLTTAGDVLYGGTSGAGTRLAIGTAGQVLTVNAGATAPQWSTPTTGTVTTVSVATANGFAGTVANATTTPAITLTTSITGLLKGNATAISAATSGTDYSAGTSALGTGILKSTTTTGALTIAVAADFPTLNQNTTGSAATLTTPRAIYGNNFDGSAALTQIIASTYGGTGNGFTKFSGATTAERTYTLPDASATLLYSGGPLGTPSSGTVTNLTGTASININGTVGATTASTGAFTTATANSFIPNLSTIPTNGMYLPATNTLGFATNSTSAMLVSSTQNLLLGQSYDQTGKIQVTGSSIFNGSVVDKSLNLQGGNNKIIYSQDYTSATYWTKTNVTLGSAVTAPDGTTTATPIIVNNGSTGGFQATTYAVTAAVPVVLSFYAKANGFTSFTSREYNYTGETVTWNLSAVTASGNGTITDVGNGWYRCAWLFTPAAGETLAGFTIIYNLATGDGTKAINIWGVQLETGVVPSAYTVTTSAAVTATNSLRVPTGGLAIGTSADPGVGSISATGSVITTLVATQAVAPTIASAATIAPTKAITFISGTTTINTITAPSPISTTGGQITLIPTGLFVTGITGNIALASTAVVNKALIMTYDATAAKWYPSY